MKNKIGWCHTTWNPVWGCTNHCEYCYARKLAKLRWKQMSVIELQYHFKEHPTWTWTGDHLSGLKDFKITPLYSQFDKKLPRKPQRIFVGSMSEIEFWRESWVKKVIEKIKEYPQHVFQFLTRHSEVYNRYVFPDNCWLGVTITKEEDFKKGLHYAFVIARNMTFLSIEPILEPIDPELFNLMNLDWIIIGAETGKRKGKIIPKVSWVMKIISYCIGKKIPIYVKDSLVKLYPNLRNIKQFPKGLIKCRR